MQISHPSQTGLKAGDTLQVTYKGKDFKGKHQVFIESAATEKFLFEADINNQSTIESVSPSENHSDNDSLDYNSDLEMIIDPEDNVRRYYSTCINL